MKKQHDICKKISCKDLKDGKCVYGEECYMTTLEIQEKLKESEKE